MDKIDHVELAVFGVDAVETAHYGGSAPADRSWSFENVLGGMILVPDADITPVTLRSVYMSRD